MEDEVVFGPEEFDKLISEMAEAALKFPRLTGDDRAAIENGIKQYKHGQALLGSVDPELLRDAAHRKAWGAYAIGSRANISDSAIIFRNINRHGPGGKKGAIKRNQKADVWRDWVRQANAANNLLTPDELAEKLRIDITAPRNLPSHDRLVRFIRKERKAHASDKRRKLLHVVSG